MSVNGTHRQADSWEHFLRARDLAEVLAATSEPLSGPVLEIGCGDGYVTGLLRQHFAEVVPIDIRPRARVAGLCVADVTALPFRDGYFGLIFSSNVLEHVEDLEGCFRELRRVTRPDAVMIHTMPTVTWKLLQLWLHPSHVLFQRAIPKLLRALGQERPGTAGPGAVHYGESPGQTAPDPGWWPRIQGLLWPKVHGVARSHREELQRFRARWWIDRFAATDLQVYRTEPLFLHSAYRLLPYHGLRFRDYLSKTGISSVRAYWVRKTS